MSLLHFKKEKVLPLIFSPDFICFCFQLMTTSNLLIFSPDFICFCFQLMTTSNLLILSLSVADTVTGINPFLNAVEEVLERYCMKRFTLPMYSIIAVTELSFCTSILDRNVREKFPRPCHALIAPDKTSKCVLAICFLVSG